MRRIPFTEDELNHLMSLTRWMDIFGFFYYITSGMYIITGVFLFLFGLIAKGGHILLLLSMSLMMFGYSIISITAGKNLFKSSDRFVLVVETDEDDKQHMVSGFRLLRKFFWLYGGLITLSLVWFLFLI